MESVESSREQRPRAMQNAYMARVVPNNPFALPPSMEVSVGGRIAPGAATEESLPKDLA